MKTRLSGQAHTGVGCLRVWTSTAVKKGLLHQGNPAARFALRLVELVRMKPIQNAKYLTWIGYPLIAFSGIAIKADAAILALTLLGLGCACVMFSNHLTISG